MLTAHEKSQHVVKRPVTLASDLNTHRNKSSTDKVVIFDRDFKSDGDLTGIKVKNKKI